MKETFDICVDDDCVDILDWINSHFQNGNWHKNFEVSVSLREIDYTEDGERIYVNEDVEAVERGKRRLLDFLDE